MRAWRGGLWAIAAVALGCSGAPDDSPRGEEDSGTLPLPDGEPWEGGPEASPIRDAAGDVILPHFDGGSGTDAGRDAHVEEPGDASLDSPSDHADGDADTPDAPSEEHDVSTDAPLDAVEPADADVPPEPDAGDAADSAGGDDSGPPHDSGAGDSGTDGGEVALPDEPATLEEAGLYSNFAARTFAPGIRPYEPAFKLWSDGAIKDRYVYLPPGSTIDASDPDHWVLPIGTRLYKTFSFGGRPVETRLLRKNEAGWFAATYAWNADSSATRRVTDGVRNALGTGYDIPDQTTCMGCHDGASDAALGFELISLANAGTTGLNLAALNAEGLISPKLLGDYTVPGDDLERAALGWLHANCGTACHNDSIRAKGFWTGFYMRLDSQELDALESTALWRTGAYITSNFQPGGPTLQRLAPGKPNRSAIVYRASTRGSTAQMPPMDTNFVDEAGVATLRAWIESL